MKFILVVSKLKPKKLVAFESSGAEANFLSLRLPSLDRILLLDFLTFKYEIAGSNLSLLKRCILFSRISRQIGVLRLRKSRLRNHTYLLIARGEGSNFELILKQSIDLWVSHQARANGFPNYLGTTQHPIQQRGYMDLCIYYVFNRNPRVQLDKLQLRNNLGAHTYLGQVIEISKETQGRRNICGASVLHGNSIISEGQLLLTTSQNQARLESFPEFRISLFGRYILRIPTCSQHQIDSAIFVHASRNWYHFWIESFPEILQSYKEVDVHRKLIISADTPAQVLEVLRKFYLSEPILADGNSEFIVGDLILISQLLPQGQVDYFNNEYSVNPFTSSLENLKLSRLWVERNFPTSHSSEHSRVFISRKSNLFRNLENRDEVEAIFEEFDFKLIDPGSMTFEEQLRYMRSAKIIAGEAGAGLTNILFANQGSRVLILNNHSDASDAKFWNDFSEVLGIEPYEYIGIKSDSYEYTGSWFADLGKLRESIESIVMG